MRSILYINNHVLPILSGEITIYYQEENEAYYFESDIFKLELAYNNDILGYIAASYACINTNAELRINELQTILKVFSANRISICISEYNDKKLIVDKESLSQFQIEKHKISQWIERIKKIDEIQKYYGIQIHLGPLKSGEETVNLYRNVDMVYDGIKMQSNIVTEIDRNNLKHDIDVSEPLKIPDPEWDKEEITLIIHNHKFVANEMFLLPVKIQQKGKRMRQLKFCLTFKLLQKQNNK